MTGSYTSEQQVFLKQMSASERTRPERADLSESEAIRRAQRGYADGFEHIYQSYCRRVYARACAWWEIPLKLRISPRRRS